VERLLLATLQGWGSCGMTVDVPTSRRLTQAQPKGAARSGFRLAKLVPPTWRAPRSHGPPSKASAWLFYCAVVVAARILF